MVLGPAGTGKTTLASLYAEAAAEKGMSSAIFCFDERKDIYLKRSDSLGLKIRQYTEDGLIDLREFHSGELFAGEFLALVRQKVEGDGIGLVIIDSMTGYLSATPDNETERTRQLHQILKYLGRAGVLTFLVMTSHGVIGEQRFVLDLSYVADTVINLKHFEAGGRVRKCLWIIKKRYGSHESRIRELLIQKRGIHIGPVPLAIRSCSSLAVEQVMKSILCDFRSLPMSSASRPSGRNIATANSVASIMSLRAW